MDGSASCRQRRHERKPDPGRMESAPRRLASGPAESAAESEFASSLSPLWGGDILPASYRRNSGDEIRLGAGTMKRQTRLVAFLALFVIVQASIAMTQE